MLEDLRRDEHGLQVVAVLRLINPTETPVRFTGFTEKSPVTKTQKWIDGAWVDKPGFLRCGTGLRPCTVPPGQFALFETSVPAEDLPVRIGIHCRLGENQAKGEV